MVYSTGKLTKSVQKVHVLWKEGRGRKKEGRRQRRRGREEGERVTYTVLY